MHRGRPEPRSFGFEREIVDLEKQARTVEESFARAANEGGMLSVKSANPLPEMLSAAEDIERLAPLKPEIEAWYAEQMAWLDFEWEQFLNEPGMFNTPLRPDRVFRFVMHWGADGTLDRERSSALNRRIDPPVPPPPTREEVPAGMGFPDLRQW